MSSRAAAWPSKGDSPLDSVTGVRPVLPPLRPSATIGPCLRLCRLRQRSPPEHSRNPASGTCFSAPPLRSTAINAACVDGIGVGITPGVGSFLSVFLVRLGATDFQVGLLTAMQALTGDALR